MDAKEIIERIEKGEVLPDELILNTDINAYLDKRDNDENFESKLVAAFKKVEDVDSYEIARYDELQKMVFKRIDSLLGTSELSCYVAEDFEVILKNIFKGTNSEFIESMLNDYMTGKLPNA